MKNIQEHVSFVKEQVSHYDKMAVKNRRDPERLDLYVSVGKKLRALLADLEDVSATEGREPKLVAENPPQSTGQSNLFDAGVLSKLPKDFFSNPLTLSASDVAGLPAEVLGELNITPSDKLEIAILDLINAAGGVLVLDKIIAGLYHVTGEVHQRVALTAKLYRMARKGILFNVPKKKGVYTTIRPAGTEGGLFDDVKDLV